MALGSEKREEDAKFNTHRCARCRGMSSWACQVASRMRNSIRNCQSYRFVRSSAPGAQRLACFSALTMATFEKVNYCYQDNLGIPRHFHLKRAALRNHVRRGSLLQIWIVVESLLDETIHRVLHLCRLRLSMSRNRRGSRLMTLSELKGHAERGRAFHEKTQRSPQQITKAVKPCTKDCNDYPA